ncbi:MAG: HAD-IIB family hydrolase [Minisyncoccia bacterium]
MLETKKVIVSDLDGTLAPSKGKISKDMAEVISHVLKRHKMAVVSGGAYTQFQKQFLSELICQPEFLSNLFLFPTNGSACYFYDTKNNTWKRKYIEALSVDEKKKIMTVLNDAIKDSGVDVTDPYGPLIEDRESQITFSGRGQDAPLPVKQAWDPDKSKRQRIVDCIGDKLKDYEVRMNATTSIDITRKGINKAYAIEKIEELFGVKDEDIIYIGDALYKGGNDEPVKVTGVDFIQESSPNETIELLSRYM